MKLALFDLDGTLLPTDSDHAFGEFMVTLGWVDGQVWRQRNDDFFAQYQAGTLNLAEYVAFATSAWRERSLAEAEAARERFMQEVIGPALHERARRLVDGHLEAGDLVAVVTATNEFVTRPIATAFGVAHLLAVELERDAQGRATGAIRGCPPSAKARSPGWKPGWRRRATAGTISRMCCSTAIPPTTCRCWRRCARPWPPTPHRPWPASRRSAAGPS
jgi:HAD superfamily phosphoserine phosphatase-like hydrolase